MVSFNLVSRTAVLLSGLLCIPFCFASGVSAQSLSPAVEADRLLLKAQKQMKAGNYQDASASFQGILQLGVKVPEGFYYHYGRVMAKTKDYLTARSLITKYINRTGRDGRFYKQSLEILVELDEIEQTAQTKKRKAEEYRKKCESAARRANQKKKSMVKRLVREIDKDYDEKGYLSWIVEDRGRRYKVTGSFRLSGSASLVKSNSGLQVKLYPSEKCVGTQGAYHNGYNEIWAVLEICLNSKKSKVVDFEEDLNISSSSRSKADNDQSFLRIIRVTKPLYYVSINGIKIARSKSSVQKIRNIANKINDLNSGC